MSEKISKTSSFINKKKMEFEEKKIKEDTKHDDKFDKSSIDTNKFKLKPLQIKKSSAPFSSKGINEKFNPLSKNDVKSFKESVSKGVEITPEVIKDVFSFRNYDLIELALKHAPEDLSAKSKSEILARLSEVEDPKIGDLVIKRYPKIVEDLGKAKDGSQFELLNSATKKEQDWFVGWAIDNGAQIGSQSNWNELSSNSLRTDNLLLIKKVCAQAKEEKLENTDYLSLIGIEDVLDDEKKLSKKVSNFALHSPLDEVYQLIRQYPKTKKILPDVIENMSLLVRFPRLAYPVEFDKKNEGSEYYNANSIKYALENKSFIEKTLKEFPDLDRGGFLKKVVEDRVERTTDAAYADSMVENYDEDDASVATPFLTYQRRGEGAGIAESRYSPSLKYLNSKPNSSDSIVFEYSVGDITYPMTSIGKNTGKQHTEELDGYGPCLFWRAPPLTTVKELQPHLEKSHNELLELDLKETTNKSEFDKKLATNFWLTSTLVEYARGTPHNAMMELAMWRKYHGLEPLVPKKSHYFLDNTALMMSCEEFVEKWPTFFEPTFEEWDISTKNL